MSKHNQDHHHGMENHISSHDGEESHGGMEVCMSGDHKDAFERKDERGHGEDSKMSK